MSRRHSFERTVSIADTTALEVIKEGLASPARSSLLVAKETTPNSSCRNCDCKTVVEDAPKQQGIDVDKILREKEQELRKEFAASREKEIEILKERFDFILHNEQIRTSFMLREAHRERQEKISALQAQLECKNLSGLMYVMCSERRKSKLEKLRVIEDKKCVLITLTAKVKEYTNYIRALQEILSEGQDLILNLSRGYKTAARVDNEWRNKMNKVVKEFQAYIYHYCGGTPDTNQYLFDLPALLKTEAPIVDNPKEDPCDNKDSVEEEEFSDGGDREFDAEKPWWEQLEGDCKPFLVFGDMAEFKPPERRAVLKVVKAAKTAPEKWKHYVFNEMYLHATCSNADVIKDEYPKRYPPTGHWECHDVQTMDEEVVSRASFVSQSRRHTSVDMRGKMGSILKIITTSTTVNQSKTNNKANLLGARDSMEIASTTKLREKEKSRQSQRFSKVILNVPPDNKGSDDNASKESVVEQEESDDLVFGSIRNDSLQAIAEHKPHASDPIHYEKVCPMETCKRMQMDSFIRALPPYMRASPFTHFEHTFDDYEACSPEQLEILQQRINDKMNKGKVTDEIDENPLSEWTPSVEGVAVQTSRVDVDLPPCTCELPMPESFPSIAGLVYRVEDLLPVKKALNEINKDCFFEENIEFDRFKIIGQESSEDIPKDKEDFKKERLQEIKRILKKYPSLCEIFQANTN